MYLPGTIFYFTPFYFKDGKTAPKNKYFIVLCNEKDHMILASMPSSQGYVPAFAQKDHGCIDVPDGGFNCYYFSPGKSVTTDGWSFPKPTYIYANWIDNFDITTFKKVYVVEGVDYEIIGRLTQNEFEEIIKCYLSSSIVKRKYRPFLQNVRY